MEIRNTKFNRLTQELRVETSEEDFVFNVNNKESMLHLNNFIITLIDSNVEYDTSFINKSFYYDKLVNVLLQHKNIIEYIETIALKANNGLTSEEYGRKSHEFSVGFQDFTTYMLGAFSYLGILIKVMTNFINIHQIKFNKEKYKGTIESFSILRSKILMHGEEYGILENNYNEHNIMNNSLDTSLSGKVYYRYIKNGIEVEIDLIGEYKDYLFKVLNIFINVFLENNFTNLEDSDIYDNDKFNS